MDRALFTGGHEREGGGSHTRSRVLCVRNMWSVTHGGIVRAKSLRPRLRACARLLPCLPTHTHTPIVRICVHTTRVSRLCISYSFPLSSFLVFIASLRLFSSRYSLSLSISPADNAAKTADLGLLTMSVGSLIRYVSRRALRYS